MSTKTTFKRIALVAVAALGFGTLSVAPSTAAVAFNALYHMNSTVCSATNSYATCGNTVADDKSHVLLNQRADYGFQNTFLAGSAGDSSTATWSLVSSPTGFNTPLISTTFWKAADENGPSYTAPTGGGGGIGGWFLAGTSGAANGAAVANGTGVSAGLVATTTATAAGATIGNWQSSFTPTVAGAYVWKLTAGTTSYTWTINAYATQVALDAGTGVDNAISVAKTTSILNTGETTTATADATVSVSMAASADQAATIVVTPKNAAGTTIANVTFPITATISGPGTLGIGSTSSVATIASSGRSITGTTGNYAVGVFSDGTAGVATVTVSTGTTVLSTETVTFYGAAAKITPTVVNSVLAIGANTGAITAVVTDAAGVAVPGVRVYAVSGTDATIDDAYVASTAVSTATGAVSFDLTGVAAGTAAITLTLNSASTGTSTVSVVAGTMRVSDGVVTKVDYAFDKESYAPGETAKITATVSNAAGVMPAGTYTVLSSAGVTANYTVAGLPAATVLAVASTGKASYTVTIPTGITGDLQLIGTAAATTIAATFGKAAVVNVALDAAIAATDAASEAIDAANAATDAANAAAEAADAATAAAQDSADAVAALAVQVTEQMAELKALNDAQAKAIAALRKQLIALTNLIIKIQKKVKA